MVSARGEVEKHDADAQLLLLARLGVDAAEEALEVGELLRHLVKDRAKVGVREEVVDGVEPVREETDASAHPQRGRSKKGDEPVIDGSGFAEGSAEPDLEQPLAWKRATNVRQR